MANILVVHGSPRKDGNSQIMADAFIEGAREAGNEIRVAHVGNAKINGCLGCEYCFTHGGECCQKDDMQNFYGDLEWADTVVYAFPLYYYSYPAQIKAFMDRQFCAIGGRKFAMKRAAMLVPFEDKDITTADGLVKSFEIAMNYSHQEILGIVLCNNSYEKGAVNGKPAIEECRKLGASIK